MLRLLRPYSQDFLDGNNLDYVKKKSKKNFYIQKNIYSLKEIIDFIQMI